VVLNSALAAMVVVDSTACWYNKHDKSQRLSKQYTQPQPLMSDLHDCTRVVLHTDTSALHGQGIHTSQKPDIDTPDDNDNAPAQDLAGTDHSGQSDWQDVRLVP
jgi:hypothetical protein